jgi:3',5'-cyclic AMP phosphodiesterase CpdA
MAQISDLHLPVLAKRNSGFLTDTEREYELFERTVLRIAGLNVDVLAVTGDILEIADSGNPLIPPIGASLSGLQKILESYATIHRILASSTLKYIIIPGNHDYEKLFWQVFDRQSDIIERGGYTFVSFADSLDDKQIPARTGRELEKFKKILSDTTKPQQIHIQHYLLTDPPEDDDAYSYKDYKKLQWEIVSSHNVILCLSGHYHKGIQLIERSGTFFAVGPAFCDPYRKYCIYQIQDGFVNYREYNVL